MERKTPNLQIMSGCARKVIKSDVVEGKSFYASTFFGAFLHSQIAGVAYPGAVEIPTSSISHEGGVKFAYFIPQEAVVVAYNSYPQNAKSRVSVELIGRQDGTGISNVEKMIAKHKPLFLKALGKPVGETV